MGAKPPGEPGFPSGVFIDEFISLQMSQCLPSGGVGARDGRFMHGHWGENPRENGSKGKLLTSSGNRRNRADGLAEGFQLVVGVAAVDILAGVAR